MVAWAASHVVDRPPASGRQAQAAPSGANESWKRSRESPVPRAGTAIGPPGVTPPKRRLEPVFSRRSGLRHPSLDNRTGRTDSSGHGNRSVGMGRTALGSRSRGPVGGRHRGSAPARRRRRRHGEKPGEGILAHGQRPRHLDPGATRSARRRCTASHRRGSPGPLRNAPAVLRGHREARTLRRGSRTHRPERLVLARAATARRGRGALRS